MYICHKKKCQPSPSGLFAGCLVVSARAFNQSDVQKVRRISSLYPEAHGGPLDELAEELGIDVSIVDFGDAIEYPDGN